MGRLSEAKLGTVRLLIEQAPDSTLRSLESALAASSGQDELGDLLHGMCRKERADRRARQTVFAPIAPLARKPEQRFSGLSFPPDMLKLLWRGLKQIEPDRTDMAVIEANQPPSEEPTPVFDELCLACVEALGDPDAIAFEPARQRLMHEGREALHRFTLLLELAPVIRSVLPRLDAWVRNLSGDNAAGVRLAFKDACAKDDEGGFLLMEVFYAHLVEPWQVLRLISAVMDRPNERFLAASEMAAFPERLLADIDLRIDTLRKFDANRGAEGGAATAASAYIATQEIAEFEQWIELQREAPWHKRLTEQKKALALAAEQRLKEAEKLVDQALPVQARNGPARGLRPAPRLTDDPNYAVVRKAEGILAFIDESRSAATYGGFGAMRQKVSEAISDRLDRYAEDLIDRLCHDEEEDTSVPDARIRAYLEIAAGFLGLTRDPKSAEIVRRRAAAA
jgi:hypothetical protein